MNRPVVLYERLGEAESKGAGLNRVDIRELASGREGDVGARRVGYPWIATQERAATRHDTIRYDTLTALRVDVSLGLSDRFCVAWTG